MSEILNKENERDNPADFDQKNKDDPKEEEEQYLSAVGNIGKWHLRNIY